MFSNKPNYLKLRTNLRLCINRLRLLEKKKTELALKARREIADYIAAGKDDRARIRVEHIIREDYLVEAMEIVEMLCDLLLARFGLIEKMTELDPGIEEAVATIIWVAPRLSGDVLELREVAHQLTIKYGKEFAEHCRKNGFESVNEKVVHKMNLAAPPKVLVENYMVEIARTYKVVFEPDPFVMMDQPPEVNNLIDLSIDPNARSRAVITGPGSAATVTGPSAADLKAREAGQFGTCTGTADNRSGTLHLPSVPSSNAPFFPNSGSSGNGPDHFGYHANSGGPGFGGFPGGTDGSSGGGFGFSGSGGGGGVGVNPGGAMDGGRGNYEVFGGGANYMGGMGASGVANGMGVPGGSKGMDVPRGGYEFYAHGNNEGMGGGGGSGYSGGYGGAGGANGTQQGGGGSSGAFARGPGASNAVGGTDDEYSHALVGGVPVLPSQGQFPPPIPPGHLPPSGVLPSQQQHNNDTGSNVGGSSRHRDGSERAPMNPQMSWINDDYLPSLPPYDQVVNSPNQYPASQGGGQHGGADGVISAGAINFPDIPNLPEIPDLPGIPSNSVGGASVGGDEVDFDDLTRRFEELKKRK